MTAGTYNFTIEQGTDIIMPLTYSDSDGNAIDITGWTARMMIRKSYDNATALADLSSPDDGIVISGSDGLITITLEDVVTSEFPIGTLVYDLKVESGLGETQRLIQGTITVSAAVTR